MEIIRVDAEGVRDGDGLTVGCVQMAPVWMRRAETLEKVAAGLQLAAAQGCDW